MQPFSGRPPGLLRKPTRGIVPSTLLRLWEGQCLHKAAPRQRGGPASFVSTRFFQAGGCPTIKPARSQPEASQKPTKPLFLKARRQPNQAREGFGKAAWALQGVKEVQVVSGCPRRSTPGLLCKPTRGIVPSTLLRLWEGQCLYKAAPRQRGGPASFSQVSTRFFQAGGCPTRKPARSQPEANQTSLLSLGLAGS